MDNEGSTGGENSQGDARLAKEYVNSLLQKQGPDTGIDEKRKILEAEEERVVKGLITHFRKREELSTGISQGFSREDIPESKLDPLNLLGQKLIAIKNAQSSLESKEKAVAA